MGISVGSLSIDIGVNPAGVASGMAAAKSAVKSGVDGMHGALDNLKGYLASLGAGLTVAAFAGWVKGAIEAADETSKMAQKLGLATEEVAGLQLAFRQAGVGEEFAQAMGKMAKSAAEGSEAFKAMGINVKANDGTLKSTRMLLGEVADAMAGYEDGTAKIALAQEIFGKSGANLIPLLNAGAQSLDEYDAMAKKLGLTLSEDTAKSAEKFNDTLDLIGQGSQGVARQVAAQLLPTLSGLADQFFTSMSNGDKLRNVADFLGTSFKVLYIAGVAIVEVFSTVGKTIGAAAAQLVAMATLDFKGAAAIGREWAQDVGTNWKDTLKQIEGAWNTTGSASMESMAATQRAIKTAAPVVKDLEDKTKAAGKAHSDLEKAAKAAYDVVLKFAQARAADRKKEEDAIEAYLLTEDQRRNATVKASNDAVAAAQAEYDNYGKTRSQIAELTLARLEDKLQAYHAGSENARVVELEIENQNKLIAIYKRGEARDAAKESADDAAKWWQKTSDDIEKGLTGALMNGFGKGKGLWDSFRDYIGNAAKSWIIKIGVQPIMGAVGSLLGIGASGSAAAGAPDPMGALANLGGSGGGILSTIFGGLGAFGTGASYGIQSLFANGFGTTMGAGMQMMGAGSTAAGLGTMAGAALPWVAGAMALKSLMDYKITPDGGGLTASLTSSGTTTGKVGAFQQFQQSSSGILSGGNTTNRSWTEADASTTTYLINSVKANTEIGKEYARMLGLNADALDGFTKNIEVNTSGMDAAAAKAAIDAELTKFATEQIAAAYGDAVKQFAMDGETALDTIKRLASIQVMSAQLNEFGGVFSKIATASIEARQSLISMAGGIDALIKKSSAFVNDYYSADEKSGLSARSILEQLKAVGLDNANTLQTKDDLRRLVETMDVSTEQGRRQVNALLDIAPQFSQIADVIKTQGGDLGTLALLAPHIASLDTLFSSDGKANDTDAVVSAQETTNENIQQTTEAVKDSTTAVVSAIDRLKATMDGVLARLDGIETNARLNNAGATFG